MGFCDSKIVDRLSDLFGVFRSDVAEKVAELPEGHTNAVGGLDFSPDGKHIAIVTTGELIEVWDWQKARIAKTIEKAHGASDDQTTEPIRYSPDGRYFVACHSRATGDVIARIWETKSWRVIHDFIDQGAGGCNALDFTPDGKFLLRVVDRVGFPGDNLIVYSTGTWQPVWGMRMEGLGANAFAVSPDGRRIAVGGLFMPAAKPVSPGADSLPPFVLYPQIYVVDFIQRKIVNSIRGDAMGPMAWSPDGTSIAVAGRLYVEIFNSSSGERLVHQRLEKSAHMRIRYTSDGLFLIESDFDGLGNGLGVKIWDGHHRKLMQEINGNIDGLAVSRDGKYFAFGRNGIVSVWRFK